MKITMQQLKRLIVEAMQSLHSFSDVDQRLATLSKEQQETLKNIKASGDMATFFSLLFILSV